VTRETKIGLLVGLAFVIVIGILISDHLSNTNEPVGAPLEATADNLRSSLGQQTQSDLAPPLQVPANISPRQRVTTPDELNGHGVPPIRFVTPPTNQVPTPGPGANPIDRLKDVARRNGEEIVDPRNNVDPPANETAPRNQAGNNPIPPQPKPVAARTYVAQPGDSLGAIARKAYGSGCKANRDAIIAANPQIADNGDLIVAGRTYLIPAIANAGAVPAPPVHNNSDRAPAETSVTYIVKSHDTLWSIATTEVGSASAVAQIRELNKDVLNGSDRVRPNMKLKLPAKAPVTVTRND